MTPKEKNNILLFLVCSSLPVFFYTMLYTGIAFKHAKRPSDFPYEIVPILIPFLFGIFGIINYRVIKKYGLFSSILVGALFGLVLSLSSQYFTNASVKIFGFTKEDEWKAYIYAMILYSALFRFLITPFTLSVIEK